MSIGAQALQAHGRWRGLAVRLKGLRADLSRGACRYLRASTLEDARTQRLPGHLIGSSTPDREQHT